MSLKTTWHKLTGKATRRILHPLLWRLVFALSGKKTAASIQRTASYTICVTTFLLRYEEFLKPLVKKLAYLFPDQDIIIVANGHYDLKSQEQYLASLQTYLAQFPNVHLISYLHPQGLSHLWNQGVGHSKTERIFLFNDDIDVSFQLRKEIERSGVLEQSIATNDGSWSQFMITKQLYHFVGPFDEGLKEIGGEDDDYLVRMKLLGIEDARIKFNAMWGIKRNNLKVNSYGKVVKEQKSGYSNYNDQYLDAKWQRSTAPLEDTVFVRGYYWKLKNPNRVGAELPQ